MGSHDSPPPDARASGDGAPAEAIVFALCHEVGNLLAAIRLHTHLLDPDEGPRALAAGCLEIDELCARASALVALTRPLLSPLPVDPAGVDPRGLLEAVAISLEDQGLRGVRLSVKAPQRSLRARADAQVLHPLIQSLAFGALEAARPDGCLRLVARAEAESVCLEVSDDRAADDDGGAWRDQARRGRPLVWALAEAVVCAWGGNLEVRRGPDGTHVRLDLPAHSLRVGAGAADAKVPGPGPAAAGG